MREIYAMQMAEGKGEPLEVGSVEDRVVKNSIRDTLVRIYRPKSAGPHPMVIWMHGGGFVLGDIQHGDTTCRYLTNNVECVVISIGYGLCPPYKFPEPENECYEIVKWVYVNAKELNIDPNRICVAGDSAGASLAAGLAYRCRNDQSIPICYQVLVYGCYDWDNIGHRSSRVENGRGYRLTAYGHIWHRNQHCTRPGDAQNPLTSAIFIEDFRGLPPALIITAEYDHMRDESIELAQKFEEAGVEVYLENYSGMIHGFLVMRQLGLEGIDHALNLMSSKIKEAFSK